MGPLLIPACLPFAVHISDGVLSWPWLVGGFVAAGLLLLPAMYRVRDEEIPRVALLTAAFFVASLIHVRFGPTSVHLLLNGLLGVVLGRRAPLAVLVGLGLQAVLLQHGGLTTLGVNTCVMALPALLAGWMFSRVRRENWMLHPVIRFVIGFAVGATAVLMTVCLNAAVLIWGAQEDVSTIAVLVLLAHLPIVVIEGVVLGFTVGFLARVKPEMLAGSPGDADRWNARRQVEVPPHPGDAGITPPALLFLAVVGLLWGAGTAQAHRLDAECHVLPDKRVQVECWFDLTGDSPQGAKVQVFRPNGELLVEGNLDEKGIYLFHYTDAEDLKVVVSAGGGHRKELVVPGSDLQGGAAENEKKDLIAGTILPSGSPKPLADRSPQVSYKDVLIGVGFLLGAAGFALGWWNMRQLRELKWLLARESVPAQGRAAPTPRETPPPAASPTDPSRR